MQVLSMYADKDKNSNGKYFVWAKIVTSKFVYFIVENGNHSSFSSRYAGQLVSLAVAITTQQEGYIYHVNCKMLASGMDKDIVSVPTVYSFTAPISCLALERYLVRAYITSRK
jgi:hypothetical protein